MKNHERIRQMTTIELAAMIMCPSDAGLAEIECDRGDDRNCFQCCLDWLMEEESTQKSGAIDRQIPQAMIPHKTISDIGACPGCGQELVMNDAKLHFCPVCGQALMREEEQ